MTMTRPRTEEPPSSFGGQSDLPAPRGSLSSWLLDHLVRPVHDLGPLPRVGETPISDEDSALALYLCYELHYRGLPDVDEAWEWEPSLLGFRRELERSFERALTTLVGHVPVGLSPAETVGALRDLASGEDGPSLSGYVLERATLEQVRELAIHRSAYQLKEADPHTFGIPRLTGRAKAALVDIQSGEYGDGDPSRLHATLFGDTMDELGLDRTYGAYLDLIPAISLATCNLISLFGLHRRWRGALVGHLALFEMCSVVPMGRYQDALVRLGLGERATAFYAEHVVADERHQVVALDEMVAGLLADEPILGGEVVYGARCLASLERWFTTRVIDAWSAGSTSLRSPLHRPE